ncbi:MAG: hypothetical protein ACEQR8_08890, partial [Cypionkella sp.]
MGAGAATLAIHGVLAAALLWGLAVAPDAADPPPPPLATFELTPSPPPPPPPPPRPRPEASSAPGPEGAAAGAEAARGDAVPREAPPARVALAEPPAAPRAGSGTH